MVLRVYLQHAVRSRTRQWFGGLECNVLGPPNVSWTSRNRGHRIGPTRSRQLRRISRKRLPQPAPSVEFTEGFLAAPPLNEAGIDVINEIRAPLSPEQEN